MSYLILFIFGSAIGSFLNVLIYRLEQTETCRGSTSANLPRFDLGGRSYCPHCKHQIRWYDNIPILSFFILRAKCRDCKGKISFQYPIVEAATGLLFLLIFNFLRQPADSIKFSIINFQTTDWIVLFYLLTSFSGLFAILVYDFKHYIIPNKIIYPLIVFVLSFEIFNLFGNLDLKIGNWHNWQYFLLSLTIPLFFLSLIIVSRGRWMGMGDVKLALFMSLFLGWPNVLIAAVLSFWLGTLASIPLLFFDGKNMKSQIPFGPFLIISTFIAYFWGERIMDWYLKISL